MVSFKAITFRLRRSFRQISKKIDSKIKFNKEKKAVGPQKSKQICKRKIPPFFPKEIQHTVNMIQKWNLFSRRSLKGTNSENYFHGKRTRGNSGRGRGEGGGPTNGAGQVDSTPPSLAFTPSISLPFFRSIQHSIHMQIFTRTNFWRSSSSKDFASSSSRSSRTRSSSISSSLRLAISTSRSCSCWRRMVSCASLSTVKKWKKKRGGMRHMECHVQLYRLKNQKIFQRKVKHVFSFCSHNSSAWSKLVQLRITGTA